MTKGQVEGKTVVKCKCGKIAHTFFDGKPVCRECRERRVKRLYTENPAMMLSRAKK